MVKCDYCGKPKKIKELGWIRPGGAYEIDRPMLVCFDCSQKLLRNAISRTLEKYSSKSGRSI